MPLTVFVPGLGRCGASAWPHQAEEGDPGHVFLDHRPEGVEAGPDAERALAALKGRGHLVGHAYGGTTALLAAQRRPDLVLKLVLVEPSCFDVARGGPEVEHYVRAMGPVFSVVDDPSVSDEEFTRRYAAGMGLAVPRLTPQLVEDAIPRMRATVPSWEVPLHRDTPRRVPTLVLTGGSVPMYEEVAEALVAQGARHVAIPGAGHRPQDTDAGATVIRDFLAD